ncbi:MAG: 4-hydroxy-tetrahydrodipicolinate reductase [Bacteroidetes bacterium]|nr:4-hydroxy-tetrahydrodipicolinate reductase [Bacteroidota bacterium]
MKIIISGYGKMGREIEKIALQRNHEILCTIDNESDWEKHINLVKQADIAIDFSTPNSIINNIIKFFGAKVPVVTGTTGWNDKFDEIKKLCLEQEQALFYASNFSIGMNILFAINKKLAFMMNSFPQYDVKIEETHHTQKLDSPSGTAISLANDIINNIDRKEKWVNETTDINSLLEIKSIRSGNITGIHNVIYNSNVDTIEIKHTALNRTGFALGAVMAAEWLYGKKGFLGMNDLLNF